MESQSIQTNTLSKKFLDELTYKILGAVIEVHREIGPGLLEGVYHKCLKQEFRLRGIQFTDQIAVPINYKGVELNADLRYDFFIEDAIILELKSIDAFAPVHQAQVLTYMKFLNCPKGMLANFNCRNIFKEGQKTFVNDLFRNLPD